ncbi:hypothetical protein MHYP_G00196630 [Metynnis hypsauchen]
MFVFLGGEEERRQWPAQELTLRGSRGLEQRKVYILTPRTKDRTMTGKGSPMTLRGAENKGSKLKLTEVEHAVTYSENSPAKKVKTQSAKLPAEDVTNGFDAAWADAVREINHILSKYSEVLRERAEVDAAQFEELESILSEAVSLESQLKEKKEHLRRSLAVISDKLQG